MHKAPVTEGCWLQPEVHTWDCHAGRFPTPSDQAPWAYLPGGLIAAGSRRTASRRMLGRGALLLGRIP